MACRCGWCGGEFFTLRRNVERGGGVYCSLACSGARRAVPRGSLVCAGCAGPFEVRVGRLFFASASYCSRPCYLRAVERDRDAREPDRGKAYRRFAKKEIERRGRRCASCGGEDGLVLHHPARTREHPDLLLDPENLEVLCRSCHTAHHVREGHTGVSLGVAHE